jgi:hypothetical protein
LSIFQSLRRGARAELAVKRRFVVTVEHVAVAFESLREKDWTARNILRSNSAALVVGKCRHLPALDESNFHQDFIPP